MAMKFLPGMTNVLEVLNQMWDAFAAGPYNALPLTGGTLTGPVTSTASIAADSLAVSTAIKVGSTDTNTGRSVISRDNTAAEGLDIVRFGREGAAFRCAGFAVSNGQAGWSGIPTVMYAGKNGASDRSIAVAGTINAGGTDYAEYMVKAEYCGIVTPGQIIGIDADGRLTDHWDDAVAFAVKSTDPCMVGGDRWTRHLGERPEPIERIQGETDAEWAARLAPVLAFDAALEAARQTVDRIAFAGQVPVNVLGATPGQYIVPVQDGEGIAGTAMHLAGMSMVQLANAVGKVIAIEDDGRARIIVKVA